MTALRLTETELLELQGRMKGKGRVPKLPKIAEKDWQEQVEQLAELFGWRKYHTWRSIKSDPGFPDLVLLRPPRLIFAELKIEGKEPTPAQYDWLHGIAASGKEAYVWYPADLEMVTRILSI